MHHQRESQPFRSNSCVADFYRSHHILHGGSKRRQAGCQGMPAFARESYWATDGANFCAWQR
eukprot:5528695-Karenia_brevis.AAC.1